MESTSRATAAGIFVVIMVAMLVGILFWVSVDKKTDRIEFDILTSGSVQGLIPQANVELHGINVGTVQSVSFVPDQPNVIQIRMMIDRTAPITYATYATLTSRGVTGTTFVDLTTDLNAPPEKQTQLLMRTSDTVPVQIPLRPTVLQSFTENATDVLDQINNTLAQLNMWLSPENSQKLFTAVENAGNAASQVAKLGETLDIKANQVMTDVSTTLKDVSTLVQSTNKLITSLNSPDGSMQSLKTALDHMNRVTLPQIDRAAHSFDSTMITVNQFIEHLDEQPQALLLGPGKAKAGPGEPGFKAP